MFGSLDLVMIVDIIDKYRYLGVWFDEHLSFEPNCQALADSGGRALGKLLNKFKSLKNIGYDSFSKLFDACVYPVLSYGAGIWGMNKAVMIDRVQNRAIRYFLGVHPKTPIPALQGDMGWLPCNYRRFYDILRLWNRLVGMESRLTKAVFLADYGSENFNWSWEVGELFDKLQMHNLFVEMTCVEVDQVRPKIEQLLQLSLIHI